MSQKINPISFRLGLFQVWNSIFTPYNNNFSFKYLKEKLNLEQYINHLLSVNNFTLGSVNWIFNNHSVTLIITYTKLTTSENLRCIKSKLSQILKNSFNFQCKIYLLKYYPWFNSALLLSSYIKFNILKGNSFKQTLKNVNKIVHGKLNQEKTLYTSKGPLTLRLKGFKVVSSGRLDNSRNQMSSLLHYKSGTLTMSKINSYVEYNQEYIYTKSGICSLHVWLIFSL